MLITTTTVPEYWTYPKIDEAINIPAGDRNILNPDNFLIGNNTSHLMTLAIARAQLTSICESLISAITMRVEQEYSYRGDIVLNLSLLLALDEAADIAPLRKLGYSASTGAGQDVMVSPIWQGEDQQMEVYGQTKICAIGTNRYAKIHLSGAQDHRALNNLPK